MLPSVGHSVSVVIPCYNGMPYIEQALDSVRTQTHQPIEIIVVDDGSKDDSAAFVERYAAQHGEIPIRLIRQANAGEPTARNTGINAATGDWVANLDTDDWFEPTKLEKQLAAAAAAGPECVLVHTGWIYRRPDGDHPCVYENVRTRVGWCTQRLLEPVSMAHPSIMVRRDALAKIGGYDPAFKQACDIDLYFRLSAVGSFALVEEPLLNYRIHPKQMSARQAEQIRYHHRAIRKFFAEHPEHAQRIGMDTVQAKLAEHLAVKLGSLYWRRKLDEFREMLRYADEEKLSNAQIEQWRRRARWPDWVIRLKDRLSPTATAGAARAE